MNNLKNWHKISYTYKDRYLEDDLRSITVHSPLHHKTNLKSKNTCLLSPAMCRTQGWSHAGAGCVCSITARFPGTAAVCIHTHTFICGGWYIYLPKMHPKKTQPCPEKNYNLWGFPFLLLPVLDVSWFWGISFFVCFKAFFFFFFY